MIIEIMCTINAMCLNYPKTVPHPSMKKLSSMKLVLSATKAGDC